MEDLTLTAAPVGTTVELSVSGMTCGGCSSSVEKALVALPGVRSASVDHATGRAVVLLASGTDPGDFAFEADAAIHDAGYALEGAEVATGPGAKAAGGCGCGGDGACGGQGKAKESAAVTAESECCGGGGGCC